MAVVLDINNTQHLSYSPLNEKHNILYNNARRSFSQRYKQKPWFRLNPFTDRDVRKGENLDSYDPGFDAAISPLQSLVIVEDYASDTPHFTKEFKISEFWDFLFSDSWSSGYAVRVFEGQLLDLMVTCLISLTRTGSVVGHTTKAFATNKRQKVTVVQKAKSLETEVVPFIETLLLRFIYYGHTVKPVCFDSESSIGYPDITSATTTDSSSIRETTDSFSSEHGSIYHNVCPSKPLPILAAESQCKNPRVARIRASKYARNQIEEERAIITRFLSNNNKCFLPCPPPIPRGTSYGYTCSNFSNASDDYKTLPPRDNLTNLLCTEKVSYLGEFTLPDDSDSSSGEDGYEDPEDFGQNFYIGDAGGLLRKEKVETTEQILKRKKAALKEMRDERKRELSKLKPKETQIMPEFSELDISKYVKEEELGTHIGLSESDRMPTFEEYAEILEDELKREARLRAKNAVKSLFSKLKEESVGDKKGKVSSGTPSIPAHGLWKFGTPGIKKLLHKKCQKVDKKKAIPKRTNVIVVPLVYISTASGMTYLHPVSKQLFLVKRVEEEKERAKELKKHFSRRTSLLPTAPTALVNELQKARQSSTTSLNQSDDFKLVGPQFPKIKLIQSEIESPDDSDDSEDDNDLDQRLFDAKKLNIRYSTDRMRKAKARRAEERKEEPHFKVILKKYIHMQAVLSAFRKTPKKPCRSPVARITRVKSKKHKMSAHSTLGTCAEKDSVEVDQFVDVGKLKWFSFLEAKDKENLKSAEQIGAFLDYYPLELFRENLERALKDFVVRREIIFSDYNNKSLVSITFTKKSVFTTSKFS